MYNECKKQEEKIFLLFIIFTDPVSSTGWQYYRGLNYHGLLRHLQCLAMTIC